MNTILTVLVIILSSILSFLVGYAYRRHQEEKMKKRVWANIVKRLHVIPPINFNPNQPELPTKKEDFDLVDELMYEHPKNWGEDDVENLKHELKIALLEEDYEKAAKIRDFLKTLDL
tara:strand:- start:258 stop:608 length:351 start_codon:yes stop_codon:yes gene_type:complete